MNTPINNISDLQQTIRDRIAKFGYTHQGVIDEDPDFIPFIYTIGLTAQNKPEFIISGDINGKTAMNIIATVLEKLEAGELPLDTPVDDVVGHGYKVVVKDATNMFVLENTVVQAVNIYGQQVKVYQIYWPDVEGRFPWDQGFSLAQIDYSDLL